MRGCSQRGQSRKIESGIGREVTFWREGGPQTCGRLGRDPGVSCLEKDTSQESVLPGVK